MIDKDELISEMNLKVFRWTVLIFSSTLHTACDITHDSAVSSNERLISEFFNWMRVQNQINRSPKYVCCHITYLIVDVQQGIILKHISYTLNKWDSWNNLAWNSIARVRNMLHQNVEVLFSTPLGHYGPPCNPLSHGAGMQGWEWADTKASKKAENWTLFCL